MAKQRNIEHLYGAKRSFASDDRIDQVARDQHLIVTRRQLLGAGLTRREIQGRLDRGRIRPIFRGVYVVGPMPPTRLGNWMAGTLAIPISLLCGRRALELQQLIDPISGPVHVASPQRARPQPGLITHRAEIPATWSTVRDHIPTVAPMLAIVQSTPNLGPTALKNVLEQAEIRSLLDIPVLDAILAAHPNLKRRARLLTAIEPFRPAIASAETRSPLEVRFLRECRCRAEIPMPATNVPLAGYEVDFLWRSARLVVETDGFEAHGSRSAFDDDRKKWAELTSLGYAVIPVTDRRLSRDADPLFDQIKAVLARAGQIRP